MLKQIMHVGVTVSDIDRSIAFYRDVLGLKFVGEILMEGKETDLLFGRNNSRCRVAYLNGSDNIACPPLELIQFTDRNCDKDLADLNKTSISEICFATDDIQAIYKKLIENNVECLSEPQFFDFTKSGFGKSYALYFRDPDGIIQEIMQSVD